MSSASRPFAAHLDYGALVRSAGDAALDEATDAAVLHGDIARWAGKI